MPVWIKNTIATMVLITGILLCVCGIFAGIATQSWVVLFIMELIGAGIITGTVQYTSHEMNWDWS